MSPDQINEALKPYGASLSASGFIQKAGNITSVKPVLAKGRLRFESATGQLLCSGRPDAEFISHFVERFCISH